MCRLSLRMNSLGKSLPRGGEAVLKLHFINVGDGDAILVEETAEGRIFRLLVDAGKADVGTAPGG